MSPPPGPTAIGIDVGGTKIAAGVVDGTGAVAHAVRRPTPGSGGRDAVLAALADVVSELRAHGGPRLVGVGVGTGGVVDHARGVVLTATDLLPGWAGAPVGPWLSERCGLPVTADNDGNTHALGELRFGAARGRADVLFAAVGTGVGGALALGGALRRGGHHTAGDIGHVAAPGAEGRRCSCGASGHLEAAAAGPAIAARHRELGGADLALPAIADLARGGDPTAAAAIAEGAAVLGRTLAGLATAIDPDAVVLGGGVTDIGPLYWEPLRAAFAAEPFMRSGAVPLLAASLGPDSSVAGAAALAFDRGTDPHLEGNR
ncbi:glucokinase [Murinocardiopsis flavida]|uniref:Glucokinase n=1 Tax=Murinocardiopsis flavida TaxID=645275 RepID=A0A2P8CXG9_9ACTN|nr:ROK family protein [Murinocardiopsis flavida]PSK89683.1 glucokinase [Murinocardiopsis flavida]